MRGERAATVSPISLVKVFSASRVIDRNALGEKVQEWIASNPTAQISRVIVKQSSSGKGHCLSIVLLLSAPP
jgi:hypothetical protein